MWHHNTSHGLALVSWYTSTWSWSQSHLLLAVACQSAATADPSTSSSPGRGRTTLFDSRRCTAWTTTRYLHTSISL
jgi:hypothetical protein